MGVRKERTINNKNEKRKNFLRNSGRIIVVCGLVMVGSIINQAIHYKKTNNDSNDLDNSYDLSQGVEANYEHGIMPEPTVVPAEVIIQDLGSAQTVDNGYLGGRPESVLLDVRNDDQVRERAYEIYERAQVSGLFDITVDEAFNMIKLIGGQNPFDRPVEFSDISSLGNRIFNIHQAELNYASNDIRGFGDGNVSVRLFPYSWLVTDNSRSNAIIQMLQDNRHAMIVTNDRSASYPYAMSFLEDSVETFILDDYLNGNASYKSMENSGERLLAVTMVLTSGELVSAVNVNDNVVYTNDVIIDGEAVTCRYTIEDVQTIMQRQECMPTYEQQRELLRLNNPGLTDGEISLLLEKGQPTLVNYPTEAMLGTLVEANNSGKTLSYK